MPRSILLILLALVAALSLGATACGGSSTDEPAAVSAGAAAEEEEEAATPAEAAAEIDTIVQMLESAVADVRAGNRDAAEETVGDAYLEHFEHVEGALEDVAPELNEEIEEALSHELRDEIKSGAKAAEIEALADEIRANLDDAEQRLR